MRGYINLVVLEQSPRATLFQQQWQALAEANKGEEGGDPGECHDWPACLEGEDLLLPAVWGTSWEATDLEDTLNGMASDLLQSTSNPPPFLATCHYDQSEKIYVAAYWSGNALDHDWWNDTLMFAPEPFGHEAPDFLQEQVELAIQTEFPAAMAFRARARQKALDESLPTLPTPTSRTPRF